MASNLYISLHALLLLNCLVSLLFQLSFAGQPLLLEQACHGEENQIQAWGPLELFTLAIPLIPPSLSPAASLA